MFQTIMFTKWIRCIIVQFIKEAFNCERGIYGFHEHNTSDTSYASDTYYLLVNLILNHHIYKH